MASPRTTDSTSACDAVTGRSMCFDVNPAKLACACFIRTYRRLGPSSPTRTVARQMAGDPAASRRRRIPATISSRSALPSIIVAVMSATLAVEPGRCGGLSAGCGGLSAGFGVGDGLLAHPFAQGVLQLGLLDEQVALGGRVTSCLRGLEVEAQPLLHA